MVVTEESKSLGTLKTIKTPILEIAYEESGSSEGPVVVLLHGFPYGPRQYDRVRDELLEQNNVRILVPYLRGYGPTRYLDASTPRSGQQAALGKDVVDFLDALKIDQAILGGYDWGGRAACVVAALWPQRVKGLISCHGYAIQDIDKSATTACSPEVAYMQWYQWYFNTEQGRIGFSETRRDFCKLLWKLWSPRWDFSDAEYQETAALFENQDFVDTVMHSYRHRFANVAGDPAVEDLEIKLAQTPVISVPTIVVMGEVSGVQPPSVLLERRDLFTSSYEREILPNIGHCVPAESPQRFSSAVQRLLSLSK